MQPSSLQHLGGGGNGPIGLLMDAEVYATMAATAYTRPTEPVPHAQHGAGDTKAAQADVKVIYKEERRI